MYVKVESCFSCSIEVCRSLDMLANLDTYFSVESLELAVSPEHKMFPLVEQNFNSEELQTGERHKQEILAVSPLVFATFELLQCKQHLTILIRLDLFTFHQGEVQPLWTRSEHLFHSLQALDFVLTGRS